MKIQINKASRNWLSFLLVVILKSLFVVSASAQKPITQAEMDKMEKDIMRMVDSLQKDPSIKRMIRQAEEQDSIRLDTPGNRRPKTPASMPVMNAALIKKLQKDTLSHSGYVIYVKKLYEELQGKLSPEQKKNITNINPAWQNNTRKLGQLSVLGWYNGATIESTVLAAKTVTLNPGNGLDANNLCAMLTMGGVAERAIPVLQYLLKQDPNNPMLLNNLAQAYAALGAIEIAKSYIAKCLALVPKHPEANATAARIAAAAGNREAAIGYAEKSLEGGYTESAHTLFISLNPPKKKIDELLAKVDLPDAFNVYKYELPQQQLLIGEADKVMKDHNEFRRVLEEADKKLEAWIEPLEKKGEKIMEQRNQELQRDPMSYVRNPRRYVRPLTALAMRKHADYAVVDFDDKLDETLNKKMKELHDKYTKKVESIMNGSMEGRCARVDAATHEYLRGKAEARINWQTKKKNMALKMFFLFSKWNYLAAPEENMAKAGFYKAASDYLNKLYSIAQHDAQYYSYCNPADTAGASRFSIAMNPSPECPFELEIPMVIGKLSLNCEEASFGISSGASFKFTQNFASKQSTLSVGVGLAMEKALEMGGAEAKMGAHIGETLFITFDKLGGIVDAGMKFGMGLSAGYGVKANVKLDQAGEIMADQGFDMSRNFGEKKADIGYSFGINSGFEFNEGPLKDLLSPKPEKQINPKVPIYRPK